MTRTEADPPATPAAEAARAASATPLLVGLVLLLVLTGPFGWLASFGAAIALWALLPQALAVLAMGTLYLLAGPQPPATRAGAALAWGGGGALAGAVPVALAFAALPGLEAWVKPVLPPVLAGLDLAWLALAVAAPLWLPGRQGYAGPLLALATGTSWLVALPAGLLAMLFGDGVLALPVLALGMAAGLLMVLCLGLLLAWPPWALRHRWPVGRGVSAVALLLLGLRLLMLGTGWTPIGP